MTGVRIDCQWFGMSIEGNLRSGLWKKVIYVLSKLARANMSKAKVMFNGITLKAS